MKLSELPEGLVSLNIEVDDVSVEIETYYHLLECSLVRALNRIVNRASRWKEPPPPPKLEDNVGLKSYEILVKVPSPGDRHKTIIKMSFTDTRSLELFDMIHKEEKTLLKANSILSNLGSENTELR